jgi:hypothetical protein
MLRTNLSSRPFYNARVVSLALAFIALVALVLTAFNAYMLYSLSARRSSLTADISRDSAQAQQISRAANTQQQSVRVDTLVELAGSTQEANELIDARTFSWTTFLGYIEKTMPNDVRLMAVAPRLERGRMKITMTVVGKRWEDVQTFVESLYGTGAFLDAIAKATERDDQDGSYRSEITSYYLPPGGTPPVQKTSATKSAPRGRQ